MASLPKYLVPAVLGIASGLGSTLLFRALDGDPKHASNGGNPSTQEGVGDDPTPRIALQQRELLHRESFEPRSEEAWSDAAPAPAGPPVAASEAHAHLENDVDAAIQQANAALQERIDRHESAPVDPKWAPEARTAVTATLGGLSKRIGFTSSDVDCRSNSCSASLTWPSYGKALETYRAVAHNWEFNCRHTVIMDAPADFEKPFTTKVLYDCSTTNGNYTLPKGAPPGL